MTRICNSQPAARFSLAYTNTTGTPLVRLRIDTNRAVAMSNVLYGGVAMTRVSDTGRHHRREQVEHHYEILNPPFGTHIITGDFSTDVFYAVRLSELDAAKREC